MKLLEPEYKKEKIRKTQKDWIDYFNNQCVKMISAPDIYATAKTGSKSAIESLKEDFKESWEVTSTRIVYSKYTLEAEIIHDADSTIVKPKSYKVTIPFLEGSFEQKKETEAYLQALFDTKDSIDVIIKTLKAFDKGKELRLWTSSQSSRADRPIRSVLLGFVGFGFCVNGYDWIDYDYGFSRGVIISSAKQTKSKGVSK